MIVDQVLENGIRPDLLVLANERRLAVIEVIVTHAPEDTALDVYERLGLPVVRVWPTWESLPDMRFGLGAELAKNWRRTVGCFNVSGACRFPRHRTSGTVPCPTCSSPARQLSVEVSHLKCYGRPCGRQVPVLDFIDCTDEDLMLLAAGTPEIPDVKAIAAQRGVVVEWKHSKTAGGSYLMHLCPFCKRPQGDNFLYGNDDGVTDVDLAAWPMTLCKNGHLISGTEMRWPTSSQPERPTRAAGLVGEPAHLFRPQPAGGFQFRSVTPAEAVRHLMGHRY